MKSYYYSRISNLCELKSLEQQEILSGNLNTNKKRQIYSTIKIPFKTAFLIKAKNYIYFPANYTQMLFLQTQIYLRLGKKKEALNSLSKTDLLTFRKRKQIHFLFLMLWNC